MGQRDRRGGEKYLGKRKPVGELETLVLGKLIPPKNTKIPWRNQGISTKGSWAAITVVLEKRRVKKSEGVRRVKSVQVYDSLVYKIGQSGFAWKDKTLLEKLRPFQDNLRTRIRLKQEIKIHLKDKSHLGWEILGKGNFDLNNHENSSFSMKSWTNILDRDFGGWWSWG
jgi:hypothetical protein